MLYSNPSADQDSRVISKELPYLQQVPRMGPTGRIGLKLQPDTITLLQSSMGQAAELGGGASRAAAKPLLPLLPPPVPLLLQSTSSRAPVYWLGGGVGWGGSGAVQSVILQYVTWYCALRQVVQQLQHDTWRR